MIPSFPKVFHIGESYISNLFDGTIEVTEKIDGCFDYETLICLADGTKQKIGYIVNNKLKLDILSYNEEKNCVEIKPIINWFRNGTAKDWKKICVMGAHGQSYNLKCTPNHQILTIDGWKQAKDITIKDFVMYYQPTINEIQKQVLLGTLLGDSSISSDVFMCGHSTKQITLLELKAKILGDFIARRDIRISGYGSTMHRITSCRTPITHYLTDLCIINGKKTINQEWLAELTPLSLAFLYMDDGSCTFNKKQEPRLRLSLNNFSNSEVTLLKQWLSNIYNIESDVCDYKGSTLILSSKDTERFFSLIHPYIIEELQYKLPEKYRTGKSVWDFYNFENIKQKLCGREVLKVEDFIPNNMTKYDIEVQDNHTFLVNNLVVHNSMFCFGKDQDGHIVMRSKGKELFFQGCEKMFAKAVDFVIDRQELIDKFENGTYFYGEFLEKCKHNVLCYNKVPTNNIVLFGAREMSTGWKSYKCLEELALGFDCDVVPLLYEGPIKSKEELDKFHELESYLGGPKLEGVVLKNYGQTVLIGGNVYPVMAKYVRTEFRETLNKEWTSGKDKVQTFIDSFRTEARWEKTIQHLRDDGQLENSPRDIGKLIVECEKDLFEEETENIKIGLFKLFKDQIKRKAVAGVAEFYKDKLAEGAFK